MNNELNHDVFNAKLSAVGVYATRKAAMAARAALTAAVAAGTLSSLGRT